MRDNCGNDHSITPDTTKVISDGLYYRDLFSLMSVIRRSITKSRITFILNVFAIVVLQLGIAFGLTCLFTQVIEAAFLIKTYPIFVWVISGIQFVLEIVWALVRPVSRVFPWNLLYLLLMTLLSSIIMGYESEPYKEDIPFIAFTFMWTVLQVIVVFSVFVLNDFTESLLSRIINIVFAVVILAGQIAYFLRNRTTITLLIAGAIGFPFTCFQLIKEVKRVFGGSKSFYPEDNIVLPARNIYAYCWSLFLTIIWVYAFNGQREIPGQ
uniref:Uncharacterized protein n=1 Tax=Trichobilharzia regenti TaxID=157069 RepID=A0AA85JF22_TRIRE|nr:unnamed protein product [Trichobilharzia regenti]